MVILTKLKKEDFNKILDNYSIGKYNSHKHIVQALENTVYLLKTNRGKFILKIFEKSNLNFIQYQVKIMDFLSNKKVPIQKIMKNKSNKYIFIYKNKKILIYKYVEGKEIKNFNYSLTKEIARKIGLLNKSLLKLKIKECSLWEKDHQFKPFKEKVNIIYGFNLKKEKESLIKDLKKINKNKLRKSIIHSDLGDCNFLFKNNKLVAIIDWDDAHKDFLIYEIATFMYNFITKKRVEKGKIKLFSREYQKYIKLNQEEKKALYYFIKNRFLGAIAWCAVQQKIHKDQQKELKKGIFEYTKRYLILNKITPEEFMGLF